MEGVYPPAFVDEQDQRRHEVQSQWNQQREKTLRKLRHIEDIEEAYAEGIFYDNDWIYTVRENIDYSDKEMEGYIDEPDQLFKDSRQKVSLGFVDRVFDLLGSSSRDPWYDREQCREKRILKILDNMGLDIPEPKSDGSMGGRCDIDSWLNYYFEKAFEDFLDEKHPELHEYWKFSKWVYTLSRLTDEEYKRAYEN
jgi:hypothetical protein